MEVAGRDLLKGIRRTVSVRDEEIRQALSGCVSSIVKAIRVALERIPPELSADISDRGIALTGGGSLFKNPDKQIRTHTNPPVSLAQHPLPSSAMVPPN